MNFSFNTFLLIIDIQTLQKLCWPHTHLGCVRLGSFRNNNNWNNASKRLFGSYSHSGIPGFPFRLFCPSEQNSQNTFRNIVLFRNIPNERALNVFYRALIMTKEVEFIAHCRNVRALGRVSYIDYIENLNMKTEMLMNEKLPDQV